VALWISIFRQTVFSHWFWGVRYATLTTKIAKMFGGPVIVLSKYSF